MADFEFEPLTGRNNVAYRAGLLADQVMPTAVICIRAADTGDVYSVTTGNRPSGFPTTELASMQREQPVAAFISHRLKKRFGLYIPRGQIDELPYVSSSGPYIEDMGNSWFPDTHYRKYFPFLATIDEHPTSGLLAALSPTEAPRNVVSPGGTEAIQHFARVHAEMLERFVGVETT